MNSITVEIILKGLIALVPVIGPGGVHHMQALVVDSEKALANAAGNMPAQYGSCLEPHAAQIEFPVADEDFVTCLDNGCELSDAICICTLVRQEISLSPEPESPVAHELPAAPAQRLPFDNSATSAGSFGYVVNLSQLGYTLNREFLADVPPEVLEARFRFPFESVLSCNLGTRPEDLADNVHAFALRSIGKEAQPFHLTQAVTQEVVARYTLRTEPNEQPVLRLRKFDGSADHTYNLGEGFVRIELMNHRQTLMDVDDPCDDGVGRDFALFYDLVESPPDYWARELPHIKYTEFKSFEDVNPGECDLTKVPVARPICAMARFGPISE